MSRRPHPLHELAGPNGETAEQMILNAIRAGGFPRVAAAAFGIPSDDFDQYLLLSERKKPRPPRAVRGLAQRVRQAQAQARLKAEVTMLQERPDLWLRSGPGKERQGDPGWTSPAKPIVLNDQRSITVLGSPQGQQMLGLIFQVLSRFPEARAALLDALRAQEATPLPASQQLIDHQPPPQDTL